MSQSPSFSPFAGSGNVASSKSAEVQTSILRYFELQNNMPKRQRRNLEVAGNAKRSAVPDAQGEEEKDPSHCVPANNSKCDSLKSKEVECMPVSAASSGCSSQSSQQSDSGTDVMIPPSPHVTSNNSLTSTGRMKRSSNQSVSMLASVSFNAPSRSETPVLHNSVMDEISPQTVKSFSARKFYRGSPKVQEVNMLANVGFNAPRQPEMTMLHSSTADGISPPEKPVMLNSMMDDISPQTAKNITVRKLHRGSTSEHHPKVKEIDGYGAAQRKSVYWFSESVEDEDIQNNNDLSSADIPGPSEVDAKISSRLPMKEEKISRFSEHNESHNKSYSIRTAQLVSRQCFVEKVISVLLLCITV